MLSRLSIRNYALIDAADMYFGGGLNILTGETGAGKSIIMGGLSLILGQRAESRYFFNQAKKCIIEGYFDISGYDLNDFFNEYELDYEKETILRREISMDGKSRAFVNDSPVTLQVLKALGEKLIDIHSQHATLQLNTAAFQLLVLDSVARNRDISTKYEKTFWQYKDTVARLQALKEEVQKANSEADYHQFLYDELTNARLEPGEQEELEEEQRQLEHAEEIKRGLLASIHALREEEINVELLLKEALLQLQQAARYMTSLSGQVERLESSIIEIKDLSSEIVRAEQDVVLDENRLLLINERLSMIYALQQKHRVADVAALISLRDELEEKLVKADAAETAIEDLQAQEQSLKQEALRLADELSESRQRVIPQIQDQVITVLREVGMPDSLLMVELNKLGESQLRQSGQDEVSFLFSANKGQMPQPVSKVASGGELSRLMLALKSIIAQSSALPTIIFDEIDTGISGEVAVKVGEVMELLAGNMQVIAITHLPQIASKGDTHFKVYKAASASKTTTNIAQLGREERVREIAEMLGGANPGATAMQHAEVLLQGNRV